MKTTDIFVIRALNEEQNDFVITIGNHLATELHFKTRNEALKYMRTPKWQMIFALIAEMIEMSKTIENSKEQEKNEQENKE